MLYEKKRVRKMTKWAIIVGVSLIIWLGSVPAWAEKAYVTNPTKITLRNGPGTDHKILAMVPQDEPVEILDSREGWNLVRLLGSRWEGKEGWIVGGFLTPRVPLEIQTRNLQEQNTRLKEKLATIETGWQELTDERDRLKARLEESEGLLAEVRAKYESLKEGAADYLRLKEAHDAAQERLADALATAEKVSTENAELRSSQRNTWFLTGGAVMLVGLIFGLVLGKREKRRKSSYY
jgi:SH3 domain protein